MSKDLTVSMYSSFKVAINTTIERFSELCVSLRTDWKEEVSDE